MSDETRTNQSRAEDSAQTEAGQPARSLEELLAEAQARIEEQRDAHLRALADAENARKRAHAEVAAAGKYAVEKLVADLLPVADSLEAALVVHADEASLRSGVELTLKQLQTALAKVKVSEINPSGEHRFDPNLHQAMAAVESDAEPNTVLSVMQKGYLLHDRVVRPALVTVAKAIEKSETNPISDAGSASNQGN